MRLGELVTIKKGRKPLAVSTENQAGYRRLIQIDDLRPGAVQKYCPPSADEVVAAPSDVIIAWDGANAGTSDAGLSGVIGSTLAILRPDGARVDSGYMKHFIRSRQSYLRDRCKGATVPHIDGRVLADLEILLPALAEQRRIAEMLDRAEALRDGRSRASALLRDLETGVFLDLFGETSQWPTQTVAEIACQQPGSIRTGPFGSQLLHSEFTSEGVAVLGIDNVVANEFRWGERRFVSPAKYEQLRRYTVRPGDVLITIMGTCGRCAVVPANIPSAINTKHLCCITLDRAKCLPSYLHAYFLRHPEARTYLEQRAKGAIMAGLNMGIISEMPVVLPPLSRQAEFEQRLTAIRRVRDAQQHSQGRLDDLRSALRQQCFGHIS